MHRNVFEETDFSRILKKEQDLSEIGICYNIMHAFTNTFGQFNVSLRNKDTLFN